MAEIMRYTKMVNDTFIEVNGNLKVNTSSLIGRRNLDDRTMRFLAEYIKFVKESGLLSKASLIWMESIETKPMDAIRTYNATSGKYKQITEKQATNSIYYDTRKLLELFPDDMLKDVIFNKVDIEFYEAILKNAISKRMKKSFLGQMTVLKLPFTVNEQKPDDEDIETFFTLFEPYTKKYIQEIEDTMPKNVIGYINYIANKKERTDDEQHLFDRLKQLGGNRI